MELRNEKSRFRITPLEERVVPTLCSLPNLCSLQSAIDVNAQVGNNGVTASANVLGIQVNAALGFGTSGCS